MKRTCSVVVGASARHSTRSECPGCSSNSLCIVLSLFLYAGISAPCALACASNSASKTAKSYRSASTTSTIALLYLEIEDVDVLLRGNGIHGDERESYLTVMRLNGQWRGSMRSGEAQRAVGRLNVRLNGRARVKRGFGGAQRRRNFQRSFYRLYIAYLRGIQHPSSRGVPKVSPE